MEFLQNHADRAVARHMLGAVALTVSVLSILFIGAHFLAAVESLAAVIDAQGEF